MEGWVGQLRESLFWLSGQFGDQFEVLVDVQNGQLFKFSERRYQQVRNRGSAMLPSTGKQRLNLNGPILDRRSEVHHRHRRNRRVCQEPGVVFGRSGREADLEQRDCRDTNKTALDSGRPLPYRFGGSQPDKR